MEKIIRRVLIILIMLLLFVNTKAKAETILDDTKDVVVVYFYTNKWNIYLTTEEIEILSRIVQLEAGGEIIESKYATVETILNRVYSDKYPNNVIDVLSQKGQFSTWKNVNSAKATPTIETYSAICDVLVGKSNILEIDSFKFNNKPIGKNPIKIGNQYYGK